MNILDAEQKTKNYIKQLIRLNVIFTNNVVYKVMRIVCSTRLFEIKNKAKIFQEEIFYLISLLNQSKQDMSLYQELSDIYFPNKQPDLFTKMDSEKLIKLSKAVKAFNILNQEIQNKLKSYESFVKKQIKVADKLYKQHKKQEYKNFQHITKTPRNISDNFKGLDDKILLQYFKQYERLINKNNVLSEKEKIIDHKNKEQQVKILKNKINVDYIYQITENELENLENYYYKLLPKTFIEISQRFKNLVVIFSKEVKNFDTNLNITQKIR